MAGSSGCSHRSASRWPAPGEYLPVQHGCCTAAPQAPGARTAWTAWAAAAAPTPAGAPARAGTPPPREAALRASSRLTVEAARPVRAGDLAASSSPPRAAGRSHTAPPDRGSGHCRPFQGAGTPRPSCGAARYAALFDTPAAAAAAFGLIPAGQQAQQRPLPPRAACGRCRRPLRRPGSRRRPLGRQPGHPAHLPDPAVRRVPRHPRRPRRLPSGSAPPPDTPAPPAPAPAAIHVQPQHPPQVRALRQSLERRCIPVHQILPEALMLPDLDADGTRDVTRDAIAPHT